MSKTKFRKRNEDGDKIGLRKKIQYIKTAGDTITIPENAFIVIFAYTGKSPRHVGQKKYAYVSESLANKYKEKMADEDSRVLSVKKYSASVIAEPSPEPEQKPEQKKK